MQPTYQVPWEKLDIAGRRLKEILGEAGFDRRFPFLFLCGLRFQFSYFQASLDEKNGIRQAGAGHLLDDCLEETCKRGLAGLMQRAKSRKLHNTLSEFLKLSVNCEWFLLAMAFVNLRSELPTVARAWSNGKQLDSV